MPSSLSSRTAPSRWKHHPFLVQFDFVALTWLLEVALCLCLMEWWCGSRIRFRLGMAIEEGSPRRRTGRILGGSRRLEQADRDTIAQIRLDIAAPAFPHTLDPSIAPTVNYAGPNLDSSHVAANCEPLWTPVPSSTASYSRH